MAATTKKTATKKPSATRKPKTAKNATAKKVSRARTTAKRATNTATASAKKTTQQATTQAKQNTNMFADQSEAMLKMGADAVRNMMSGAPDASQFFKGMPGNDQFGQSAQAASSSMNDMMNMGKDHIDTAVTCSSIAVNAGKNIGAELFNYANKSFSQNVEMSKEVFGCRTLNDMFDLQSKVMKTNMEHFINESVKMSEMMFKAASQVSEPLNERISESTKRMSKNMSNAA